MVGEIFSIYVSQMFKNHLKLSTMVGDNVEIYLACTLKNCDTLETEKKDGARKVLVPLY